MNYLTSRLRLHKTERGTGVCQYPPELVGIWLSGIRVVRVDMERGTSPTTRGRRSCIAYGGITVRIIRNAPITTTKLKLDRPLHHAISIIRQQCCLVLQHLQLGIRQVVRTRNTEPAIKLDAGLDGRSVRCRFGNGDTCPHRHCR